MHRRRVKVAASSGLHARPAALLAKAAAAQGIPTTIAKVSDGVPGEPVDTASIIGLMTLGAHQGDEVEIAADEEAAVDALAELVSRDLDEDVVLR
ncbi:HPr family phosphocarrier protein [Actinoalloteichus hymeniacidonis]|uniref:Phosphocarrier protein HPr n=1 Tax=Actinoalloteichus hymeniacidonis TaxID=340345 RepID=A0AAC9MZP7_9PSEU|nr:HPr family phosphocarrier protein [Actinoalloteichus hymeniacidonis]AOS64649.1 phosphotransferase system HPr (HPr) family protein [Actinoalloteichus hymeniacidonis]MBB5907276.1 phosphocarrier protein [Actinoalloteichus hymeniacidonis]